MPFDLKVINVLGFSHSFDYSMHNKWDPVILPAQYYFNTTASTLDIDVQNVLKC